MQIVKKYYEKTFSESDSKKENYLEACKWLALNVISKQSIYDTIFDIEIKDSGEIILTLLAIFDDKKLNTDRCNSCKEFSKSFFISEKSDCERCKLLAMRKEIESTLLKITNIKKKKI